MIILKSKSEIDSMRRAGRIVAQAHELLKAHIKPGVKTKELDVLVEEFFRKEGAIPAFKGYRGYPACICTSVNDEVVHGIPGERVLEEGDIIGVDIGAIVDGYCGDAAWTYPVGQIEPHAQDLLEVTEQALYKGIAQMVAGNRLTDISHAIERFVEERGYCVVRDFVGHGIGRAMHEEPQVPNFGPPGRGPVLKPGMTLAVEPMVNSSDYRVRIAPDQWTVYTLDGGLSAHFEHTVAVTEGEPLILTAL
ncbi:MAG: type I methionyl aminopeptidase [Limnochordia bacterium]|jgi:methionyl aminopeptidase|nr:type I methionyl aminopeptidase [Bacillota bacterium]